MSAKMTEEGLIQLGLALSGLSLGEINPAYADEGAIADLSEYFGDEYAAQAADVVRAGGLEGMPEEAFVAYQQTPTAGGVTPEMSRAAMYAATEPGLTPVQARAARDAALGIVSGAGNDTATAGMYADKYAQINGQMYKLTPDAYDSIVNRDGSFISEAIAMQPQASEVQQPEFPTVEATGAGSEPMVPQSVNDTTDPMAQDFIRTNQNPVDNTVDAEYEYAARMLETLLS